MNNNMGMFGNNNMMGMEMNSNMGMLGNNNMMGMQMSNNMGMLGNNNMMGMQMNNNMGMFGNKEIFILFQTRRGRPKKIYVDYGTSVGDLLKKYLIEIGHPELINNNDNGIYFIFNGMKLSFEDTRNIKELELSNGTKIIVIDTGNIMGG